MRTTIFILAMLMASAAVHAQPMLDWQTDWGLVQYEEELRAIVPTGDGGFIGVGRYDISPTEFGGLLMRFNPDGTILWNTYIPHQINLELNDVTGVLGSTDYIAVGTRYDAFAPIIYVIRFNGDNGALLYNTSFGTLGDDEGCAIIRMWNGDYLVAGKSTSSNGYVAQITTTLDIVYTDIFDLDAFLKLRDIKEIEPNEYIACGHINEPPVDNPLVEFWMGRISFIGGHFELIWDYRDGNVGHNEAVSVIHDPAGGFVAAGTEFHGTIGDANNQVRITKLNDSGVFQWTRLFGSSSGEEFGTWVGISPEGGYHVGGWGQSAATNGVDCWLIKTNSNGIQTWNRIYGGADDQFAYDWAIVGDGRFGAVGETDPLGNFDAYGIRLILPQFIVLEIFLENPELILPYYGGSFPFIVDAINTNDEPETKDAWIQVEHLETHLTVETFNFQNVNFPPNQHVEATLNQTVPGIAPAGTYQVTLYVGNHPWQVESFASTEFQKEGGEQTPDAAYVFDQPELWTVSGTIGGQHVATEPSPVPGEFSLSNAYPNPFNPSTTVSVNLPEAVDLKVVVFNVTGQQVATLADGPFAAGSHSLTFDGSNLASGVYIIRATIPGQATRLQKTLLVR